MVKIGKFITFDEIEKERIERVLDDLDLNLFFGSGLYGDDIEFKNGEVIYIGFEGLSKFKNVDITDNVLDATSRWLFSYEEEKNFYRFNIGKAINDIFNKFLCNYDYHIIDYFFLGFNDVNSLIKSHFLKNIDKVYVFNHSIYFLKGMDIYNISLKMIKFYDGAEGIKTLIEFLEKNCNVFILDTKKDKFNFYGSILTEYIDEVLLERYTITLF